MSLRQPLSKSLCPSRCEAGIGITLICVRVDTRVMARQRNTKDVSRTGALLPCFSVLARWGD